MCDLHSVYLGFGVFLQLNPRITVDIKDQELLILGHVMSDDPTTSNELVKMAIKKERICDPTTNIATAAAGSTEQLPRVEAEMNISQVRLSDSLQMTVVPVMKYQQHQQ